MYNEDNEIILKRMEDNINNEVAKGEGTYTNDVLSATSIELEYIKDDLEEILQRVFIDEAFKNGFEDEVIERAYEMGIYRKEGKKASGTVTFYGAKDTEIKKGTLVQTKNQLQFKTIEDTVIRENGEIDAKIEAIEIGNRYNVKANTITEMPIQLINITSIKNKNNIENGVDIESIEDLYKRYKIKVTTPATSGNKYQYYLWAMEVEGVGDCVIKPLWNGNGTVKVILIDQNKEIANKELIDKVKKHIEEVRPIGADVTVASATELKINVNVTVEVDKSIKLETIKQDIENNIKNYIKEAGFKEKLIRYTRIANCILDVKGVIDYSNLTINKDTKNIKLTDEQVPVLEGVVINNEA